MPAYLEQVRDAVDSPADGHLYHFTNFFESLCVSRTLAIPNLSL